MALDQAIINLLVGIATFLIGMKLMSDGLSKCCGRGVKRLFKHTEKNRFISLGIGAGATALIQSSAATSVMVIGFLSAGVMTIFQGVCIILGAYVGTTMTGILVSFSSFGSPSKYLVLLAVVGVILMFFKNEKVKYIGTILAGLGLLFFGLSTMSGCFKDCADIKNGIATFCSKVQEIPANPILFLLIGAIFTALVQSSSATSGIVIVMVGSGAINFTSGMYLVLGATIGTVITTILASIGGNTNVKRTAIICLCIRIFTALLGLAVVWPLAEPLSNFFANNLGTKELGLALFSVFYAIISVLIILPFVQPIINLFSKIIKDKDAEKQKKALKFIDNHLLRQPDVAMMQVKKEILNMFKESYLNFTLGVDEISNQNFEHAKEMTEREDELDYLNNAISDYLIALSNKVTLKEERIIGGYFHMINDIERIGDHAYNFHEEAEKMHSSDLVFSDTAKAEFSEMITYINQMFDIIVTDFDGIDQKKLSELHELEDKTDKLKLTLSQAHFERITKQKCKMELSPFYSTFLSELERVADHLVNIGYAFVNPTGDEEIK